MSKTSGGKGIEHREAQSVSVEHSLNQRSYPPCAAALRKASILAALLIPLKLALAYLVLIPTIFGWLISRSWRHGVFSGPYNERSIVVPLALLLFATTCSAIIGLDPIHSTGPLLSLLFFALTIFIYRDYGDSYYVPLALLTGQAIAALHSVIQAATGDAIPTLFLGSVTESGQLALSILLCLGLTWEKIVTGRSTMHPAIPRVAIASGTLSLFLLGSLGFHQTAGLPTLPLLPVWLLGLAAIVLIIRSAKPKTMEERGVLTLSVIYLPLLVSALLVNLKRGPWLGVSIGIALFLGFYARRLLILSLIGVFVTAIAVPPIRERLAVSYDHFTISGGRSTIWKIGGELITQYPMGIGYHNSGVLRDFSLEIPKQLKHFHNNVINITAESGVLTLGIFLWFIYATLRVCFSRPLTPTRVAIGCALISWQTAGLVEYNFGDSEVMIIVWILLGTLLLKIRREERAAG